MTDTTMTTENINGTEMIVSYHWDAGRDNYGRSVHTLRRFPAYRAEGVVVKHPGIKVGQPGAYWFTDWRVATQTNLFDDPSRQFPTLKAAKAAFEARVTANPVGATR